VADGHQGGTIATLQTYPLTAFPQVRRGGADGTRTQEPGIMSQTGGEPTSRATVAPDHCYEVDSEAGSVASPRNQP
jgi:hypothetical protein